MLEGRLYLDCSDFDSPDTAYMHSGIVTAFYDGEVGRDTNPLAAFVADKKLELAVRFISHAMQGLPGQHGLGVQFGAHGQHVERAEGEAEGEGDEQGVSGKR